MTDAGLDPSRRGGALSALRRWKRSAVSRLDASEALFPLQTALRGHRRLALNDKTELVIEGYPRSGNTFAVAAFTLAQQRDVPLAHHLHAPAQVLLAARRGVPCLVLVRDPVDAALSRMIRRSFETARSTLGDWVRFHRAVLPVLDRVVVASFAQITTDFGEVIDRVNAKFATEFRRFDHSEENERRAFERVEEMERADSGGGSVRETHVARPSEARAEMKAKLHAELDAPELARFRAAADGLHARLLDAADAEGALQPPASPRASPHTTASGRG